MNRDSPKAAVSLRQAPTDRAPSGPVMSNAMVATSFNDTMTDHARVQVGHAPLQRGQGTPSVTIAQRLEKLEKRVAAIEAAQLDTRVVDIEATFWPEVPTEAAAPQTTPGEIDAP